MTQDDMPKVLYIISDMQFDSTVERDDNSWHCGTAMNEETNFEAAKTMFKDAGFTLPHVVFWNVNAQDDSPATMYDGNVTLVSGSSPSTFKYAVEGKSPIEFMEEVLNSERYEVISN